MNLTGLLPFQQLLYNFYNYKLINVLEAIIFFGSDCIFSFFYGSRVRTLGATRNEENWRSLARSSGDWRKGYDKFQESFGEILTSKKKSPNELFHK